MNRWLLLFLVAFFFPATPLFAEDVSGFGDSEMNGAIYSGTGEYPDGWSWVDNSLIAYCSDKGLSTYDNHGADGLGISNVLSSLESQLTADTPSVALLHVGINDIAAWGTTLSTYMSGLDTFRTTCASASATPVVNQIFPPSSTVNTTTVKLWNASIESWGYTNSVAISPTFQPIASTSAGAEETMNLSLSCDGGGHLTAAGYTLMGHIMAHAQVPARKRVWGATGNIDAYNCQDFGYVPWTWAVLSGSASVTENNYTGVVNLAQNETADLTVECLPTGNKTLNLSAVCRSGAVTIYYRTAATTNFARNAAAEWTQYTEAFATTDQFIQVRLSNASETSAVVRYAGMTWTGSPLGAETDPEPIPVSLGPGYSGTASWQ